MTWSVQEAPQSLPSYEHWKAALPELAQAVRAQVTPIHVGSNLGGGMLKYTLQGQANISGVECWGYTHCSRSHWLVFREVLDEELTMHQGTPTDEMLRILIPITLMRKNGSIAMDEQLALDGEVPLSVNHVVLAADSFFRSTNPRWSCNSKVILRRPGEEKPLKRNKILVRADGSDRRRAPKRRRVP